jgi:hypothetical protein
MSSTRTDAERLGGCNQILWGFLGGCFHTSREKNAVVRPGPQRIWLHPAGTVSLSIFAKAFQKGANNSSDSCQWSAKESGQIDPNSVSRVDGQGLLQRMASQWWSVFNEMKGVRVRSFIR